MVNEGYDLREVLQTLDPAQLDYQEWLSVGMALKEEGYTAADWDAWSQRDHARYHAGECFRKWDGFHGHGTPVTAGTVVQLARNQGWQPPRAEVDAELDWEAAIGAKDELVIVNRNWVEGKEVAEPEDWDPAKQLITYLETLFEASENVGYVTRSYEKDGRFLPERGCYDRTAGRLIEQLSKCGGDVCDVIGDYNLEAGAWIRFNPLDGRGVKNENVTEYRYALVESDETEIEAQNAIIRELELPVACLVHSGGKSLHAIVRIDAGSYDEYRKRVDYLYTVCEKNGLKIDSQNRNPSRLSRMPGILRGGHRQFLVDTNIGKASYAEWQEWIESVNDDLPEPESMADAWDNLPELSPPLIGGVLRQGHKMLLAGPSKAGKSYALIELCCAIAEGRRWLGWVCARGKVLYVNLELDRASCLHRFRDVYTALGWQPKHLANIDVWNLRGKSIPMDKLAPKLIRRAAKKQYIAIVIDPIYKVITGDENSADQMAHFCNQFDRVCTELGCAVIYCHHHSKGRQGQKQSMDRASGSGVFARDPDALLDLIELDLNDGVRAQAENAAACAVCEAALREADLLNEVSQDDLCSGKAALRACRELLPEEACLRLDRTVEAAKRAAAGRTAWRVEGTLREFPKFPPVNLWFDYPVHTVDMSGTLVDVEAESESSPRGYSYKRNFTRKKSPKERAKEREQSVETAFAACKMSGKVTVSALSEYMGVTEKTVRNRLKEHGGYWIDEGTVGEKGS